MDILQFATLIRGAEKIRAESRVTLVVHTAIFRRPDEILLLRRSNTGFMDGFFSLPGGHVNSNELVQRAACREVLEETHLSIEQIRPAVVMPYDGGVDFIFVAEKWSGNPIIGEPDKCSEIRWSTRDRLPDNTVPFVAKALQCVDEGIWYHEFRSE